jgi:hypothetical protein
MGDTGFLKSLTCQYRAHVYLSDVVRLGGRVDAKEIDGDGSHVVRLTTWAGMKLAADDVVNLRLLLMAALPNIAGLVLCFGLALASPLRRAA